MKKILFAMVAATALLFSCSEEKSEPVKMIVHVRGVKFDVTEYSVSAKTGTAMPTLITPVISPEDATDNTLVWSSSNADIIDVDKATGVLTRTDQEITQQTDVVITATSESGVYGKVTITLGKGEFVPIESVTVNSESAVNGYCDIALSGSTMPKLTTTILPEQVLNKQVTWSSDKPEIVAVDPTTGALSYGSEASSLSFPRAVRITATAENGVTGSINIMVGCADFDSISFECEDTNWMFNQFSSYAPIWFGAQENQSVFSNGWHLFWWNDIYAVMGTYITVEFNNVYPDGRYDIDAWFSCAADFGIFDLYINDVKVMTNADFGSDNLGRMEKKLQADLVRGVNKFKAVVTGVATRRNWCAMIGLDNWTIAKTK